MATNGNTAQVQKEISEALGRVPEWVKQLPPASLEPFWRMFVGFYLADTAIPTKYKELIGLAVSGATRCRYCALFHTEGARLQGATDVEIAEASTMAGFTMMTSTFLNAQQIEYAQFKKETLEIFAYVRQAQGKQGRRDQHARA